MSVGQEGGIFSVQTDSLFSPSFLVSLFEIMRVSGFERRIDLFFVVVEPIAPNLPRTLMCVLVLGCGPLKDFFEA